LARRLNETLRCQAEIYDRGGKGCQRGGFPLWSGGPERKNPQPISALSSPTPETTAQRAQKKRSISQKRSIISPSIYGTLFRNAIKNRLARRKKGEGKYRFPRGWQTPLYWRQGEMRGLNARWAPAQQKKIQSKPSLQKGGKLIRARRRYSKRSCWVLGERRPASGSPEQHSLEDLRAHTYITICRSQRLRAYARQPPSHIVFR